MQGKVIFGSSVSGYGITLMLLALLAQCGAGQVLAHEGHSHHASVSKKVTRSVVEYAAPEVSLIRDDGRTVVLADELNDGRPVVLNFIYTSCTAICPLSSQVLAQFQKQLGKEAGKVHVVSISIDPEQDTPERLRGYAKKYAAGKNWQHYSGSLEASIAAQKAFDAYRGDKMNHVPVTLLRAGNARSWVRFDGFVSAEELVREYKKMVQKN